MRRSFAQSHRIASPLKAYVLLIPLILATTSLEAQSREKILFNCSVSEQSSAFIAAAELYQTAFDELGYDFEMQYQPGRRGLSNASNGIADGECGRVKDLGAEASSLDLVLVDVAILRLRIHLWTFTPALAEVPLSTILASPYRIAYGRGSIAAMQALQSRNHITDIAVNDFDQALRMLVANRVDYVVGPKAAIFPAIEELGLSQAPLIAGSLDYYSLYPYLSARRRHLAEPLAQALKRLLDDPNHPFHQFND